MSVRGSLGSDTGVTIIWTCQPAYLPWPIRATLIDSALGGKTQVPTHAPPSTSSRSVPIRMTCHVPLLPTSSHLPAPKYAIPVSSGKPGTTVLQVLVIPLFCQVCDDSFVVPHTTSQISNPPENCLRVVVTALAVPVVAMSRAASTMMNRMRFMGRSLSDKL